jgi:hypothetical protein
VEVNDPTRDGALRRVCLPATSSSDPPCIFALKLTGYYSSTGFGLLLVEAAAVIATFFHSFIRSLPAGTFCSDTPLV